MPKTDLRTHAAEVFGTYYRCAQGYPQKCIRLAEELRHNIGFLNEMEFEGVTVHVLQPGDAGFQPHVVDVDITGAVVLLSRNPRVEFSVGSDGELEALAWGIYCQVEFPDPESVLSQFIEIVAEIIAHVQRNVLEANGGADASKT